jgi:hypothetical protein
MAFQATPCEISPRISPLFAHELQSRLACEGQQQPDEQGLSKPCVDSGTVGMGGEAMAQSIVPQSQ